MAEGRALENMPPEGRDVGHALKPAKGERALERGSRGRERERAKERESQSPWSRGENQKTCCLGAAM